MRWLVAWGPAAIWAAFLFVLSSREGLPVNLPSGLDKLAHFGAYFVLGFLAANAARRMRASPWLAVTVGLVYGALDELHQTTVTARHASMGDWFADAAGTAAGVLLYLFLVRIRKVPRRVAGPVVEATET